MSRVIAPRWAVLWSLLGVSFRTVGLGRIASLIVLGAAPLIVTLLRDEGDLAVPMFVFSLVAGASVGMVADDPATAVLAPCPIPASNRVLARLLAAGTVVIIGCGLALALVRVGSGLPSDWIDRLPESLSAAAVALAVGLFLRRRDEPHVAQAAIAAGLLIPLTITALAVRWPTFLPGLSAGPTHVRWWLVILAGAVVAVVSVRDPARAPLTTHVVGTRR